jgi:monothiol glutaredoxin
MSDIQQKIRDLIDTNSIVLFMKGSKESPQCGFSAQVVNLLKAYQAEFQDFDVLEDWDLREGIKAFSQWPTIPQLYVKGEFVGGCDITMDLHRKGELKDILAKAQA